MAYTIALNRGAEKSDATISNTGSISTTGAGIEVVIDTSKYGANDRHEAARDLEKLAKRLMEATNWPTP